MGHDVTMIVMKEEETATESAMMTGIARIAMTTGTAETTIEEASSCASLCFVGGMTNFCPLSSLGFD